MKKTFLLLLPVLTVAGSCSFLFSSPEDRQGGLRISFAQTELPGTKASSSSFPDTNNFYLSVCDASGNPVFEGIYGDAPETIMTAEGSYTVSAQSCEFSDPAFDKPQYGDTQVVAVKSGETTNVILSCVQLNCGIKLNIASGFLTKYPDGVLFLKSSTGKLMYSYSEKRIAYFQPGNISVVLNDSGTDEVLFSRVLTSQQILSVTIATTDNAQSSSKGGITVQVDTSRTWLNEYYTIGGENGAGSTIKNAFSVAEAKKNTETGDVWVYGYIVGGDLSSSKCSFAAPFSSRTNLVLATKSSCKDKASCLSVQLAKGNIRNEINLVDHPDMLGRQIYLKGDIVASYYGIPGLQSLTEYEFK